MAIAAGTGEVAVQAIGAIVPSSEDAVGAMVNAVVAAERKASFHLYCRRWRISISTDSRHLSLLTCCFASLVVSSRHHQVHRYFFYSLKVYSWWEGGLPLQPVQPAYIHCCRVLEKQLLGPLFPGAHLPQASALHSIVLSTGIP